MCIVHDALGRPPSNRFVGRQRELNLLKGLLRKRTSSLVVIRGRRRIGKSRLAHEFARSFDNAFIFSGLPPPETDVPVSEDDQRAEFARQMQLMLGEVANDPTDWTPLLWQLAEHTKRGRVLVVLDEITWLGGADRLFLGKLKNAWDLHFSRNSELVMILSDSLSLWIDDNILHSTAFFGRVSLQLKLEGLALVECRQFWGGQAQHVSSHEVLRVLSVTGGVPRYLEEIIPSDSAEANIKRLCFSPSGLLFHEFAHIFAVLFGRRGEAYGRIITKLAAGRATLDELVASCGGARKGMADKLDHLIEAGFVARDFTWLLPQAKASRLSRFRLCDNYLRFYLKYIQPNREQIERGAYEGPSAWPTVMGLQFENLMLANRDLVLAAMGVDLREVAYDGPFFQRATKRNPGCQIDYLVQTKHRSLYACEAKFVHRELGLDMVTEVSARLERLKTPKGFSIRPVLIHVNGVSPEVVEQDYFSHIVDFGSLTEARE